MRIQLADQRAVIVTLPVLPLVSRLFQRILQAAQRTKEPHRRERERRKEREKERKGLQKSALGTLQSLSEPDSQNMLIFLLSFCYRQ